MKQVLRQTHCADGLKSKFTVILGTQWGDEGKGKLVDILAKKYDVCARFNGGSNAGHTIVVDGVKYALHLLPCGILYPQCMNLLGNGVVINPQVMFDELAQLDKNGVDYKGRLLVSNRAHFTSNLQREVDGMQEQAKGDKMIGTTKQGIGPTYASKALRIGLRMGDLVDWKSFLEKYNHFISQVEHQFHFDNFDKAQELDQLRTIHERMMADNMIIDSTEYMHQAIQDPNKRIIAEGANATMLDTDHGTYPYVTSSSTVIGGVCTGLGVPPQAIETTIGVVKAYTTRVGAGPFPTWLDNEIGDQLQRVGHEFGATTGRVRKCGWLDLNVVKYANKINGLSSINLTKLDVLSNIPKIEVCTHYTFRGQKLDGQFPATIAELAECKQETVTLDGWTEDISEVQKFEDLPENAQKYVKFIENETGVPVTWIGTGPKREDMFLQ